MHGRRLHWTLSVLPHLAVLASVNLARRQEPLPPSVHELLHCLAAAPDDTVRVITEFVWVYVVELEGRGE